MRFSCYVLLFAVPMLLPVFSATGAVVTMDTPVTGWTPAVEGNPVITGAGTSSPVWGSGLTNSADNTTIFAPFTPITLGQPGDSLTVSGGLELLGAEGGYDQLRIGLFNSGGSTNNLGWTGGYFFSNSHADRAGYLRMRRDDSPTRNLMTAAAATVKGGNLFADGGKVFQQGNYNFRLELLMVNENSIRVGMFLSGESVDYVFSHTYLDTTASRESFTLDRVGFLSGDDLNTDQVLLKNILLSHSYTAVPEPSSLLCGSVAAILAFSRRGRPGPATRTC